MTGAELFVLAAPAAMKAIDELLDAMEATGHAARVRANHDIALMKAGAMLQFHRALLAAQCEQSAPTEGKQSAPTEGKQ